MKMKPIFLGTIKSGKLQFHDKDRFLRHVESLGDGIVEMTVEKRRRKRSDNQNAYLWGVVYELISQTTGHTPEEVHDICKTKFCRKYVGKYVVVSNTSKMTTAEFGEYIDKVVQWAATELEIIIPPPYTINYE